MDICTIFKQYKLYPESMKKITIPADFFIQNRNKLIQQVKKNSLLIITSNDELTRSGDQLYPFRQNADLFYLTGLEQEKCMLVICPEHPNLKLREVVFSIKPNQQLETWTGHKYTAEEIREISGVETVKWLDDLDMTLREMALFSENIYLNLNEYSKYLPDVNYRDYTMVSLMKEKFPLHQFERLAPIITRQRTVKNQQELELLKQACSITGEAFKRVLDFVKPGVTEYEIEAELTHAFIFNGARGHAYQPIIGSGENALVLHYLNNSETCKEGDLLLLDFGAEYANYAADCSRTIPVDGKFTQRQKACYEAVLRIQKEAVGLFVPGNTIDQVNTIVWDLMEKEMIGLGLFSLEDVKNQTLDQPMYFKYLMHGVTHFIGLDVHDVGSKYQKFEKGMVLTIEPGLYIKEENIGIRIEDNILVDDTPVNLMYDIPKEVEDIERLMKGN